MKDTNNTESIGDFIRKNIYVIRGTKVMLDSDLAQIYGYTTKTFNQQVKNNITKFDEDFRFKLTKEEHNEILRSKELTLEIDKNGNLLSPDSDISILRSKNLTSKTNVNNCESDSIVDSPNLKSKNLTSSWGGKRKLPHVFTEQGIYMLMTVLKGKLATEQSKALIRTFKEMKDFIINNQGLIGNKELLLLSVQTTQNTADIAEIKNNIKDNMVTKADLAKVIHDFTDPNTRKEYLILNGESVEANLAYSTIYQSANHSVFVIDNYIGLKTLVLLKNIKKDVAVTIFSDNIGVGLHQDDFDDFQRQYPHITISFKKTCGIYHDRYIVLDYKTENERIYHCGASSKDAGNKVTTISQVSDLAVYHQIVDVLVTNPILTLK